MIHLTIMLALPLSGKKNSNFGIWWQKGWVFAGDEFSWGKVSLDRECLEKLSGQ